MANIGNEKPTLPFFLVLLRCIMQHCYQTRYKTRLPSNQGESSPQAYVFAVFVLRINGQFRNIGNQFAQIVLIGNIQQIQNTSIKHIITFDSQLLGRHVIDSDNLSSTVGRKYTIRHVRQDTG